MRTTEFTDTKIATLKTTMETKSVAYDNIIDDRKKTLIKSNAATSASTSEDIANVFVLSIEVIPIENGSEPTARVEYKDAERAYNRAVLLKVFADENNKLESYKFLAKYLETNGENYISYIVRKKKEGATEATLIKASKALLINFLETAVNRELKQK